MWTENRIAFSLFICLSTYASPSLSFPCDLKSRFSNYHSIFVFPTLPNRVSIHGLRGAVLEICKVILHAPAILIALV
uniref:Putative secreted protein n=1 Tax=Anopheles marajoara TaxID=58244 RepID=A0A2M4CD14_9DIPT